MRIRTRDVVLATRAPTQISAQNVLHGTVSSIGPAPGAIAEVVVKCGGELLIARVTRRSVDQLALAPGREVWALIKTVALDRRSLGLPPGSTEPRD